LQRDKYNIHLSLSRSPAPSPLRPASPWQTGTEAPAVRPDLGAHPPHFSLLSFSSSPPRCTWGNDTAGRESSRPPGYLPRFSTQTNKHGSVPDDFGFRPRRRVSTCALKHYCATPLSCLRRPTSLKKNWVGVDWRLLNPPLDVYCYFSFFFFFFLTVHMTEPGCSRRRGSPLGNTYG